MGRWGADVVALACIAGGAVVGAGVTAGLSARDSDPLHHRVDVACGAAVSSSVVVRLSGGDVSAPNVRVMRSQECSPAIRIDVAEIQERVDRARARAEVARVEAEGVRHRMEEVRHQMEAVRHQVEAVRIPAEEARLAAEQLRESADEARIEAMERQLEAVAEQLESSLSGGDLETALEALQQVLRAVPPPGGSGGND